MNKDRVIKILKTLVDAKLDDTSHVNIGKLNLYIDNKQYHEAIEKGDIKHMYFHLFLDGLMVEAHNIDDLKQLAEYVDLSGWFDKIEEELAQNLPKNNLNLEITINGKKYRAVEE